MSGFPPGAILLVVAVVAMMLGLNAMDVPGCLGRVPQLVVATAGTVWAARQFQSSDPPRLGWVLLACAGPLALIIAPLAAVVLNLQVPAPAGSLDGTTWAVRRIVGVAADIVVFNAALQMFRITYPMRRGLVATPYLLLALTAALFMLVVLGLALATALLQTELGLTGRLMDTLAWSTLGLAGFAQARTVRHTRSE